MLENEPHACAIPPVAWSGLPVIVEIHLPDGHVARLSPDQLDTLRHQLDLLAHPMYTLRVSGPPATEYVPPPVLDNTTGSPLPAFPVINCQGGKP